MSGTTGQVGAPRAGRATATCGPSPLLWAVLHGAAVVHLRLVVPTRLMGTPASTTMTEVERTFTRVLGRPAPVAALVWAVAVLQPVAVAPHGGLDARRPRRAADPRPRLATGLWMFGSSALCLFLLIWGLAALSSVESPASAATPLVVDVTGQQWVWTFTYPQHGQHREPTSSTCR